MMLVFLQRMFPSANSVLVTGKTPVLIDTGFGSDFEQTEALLREAGVPPEGLALAVNTHYHCDHVGGNHALQGRYNVAIAAHRWEAAVINRREYEACSANWLDQPIEAYRVDRPLDDGDEIEAGDGVLRVIHTPGHTLGHIALYDAQARALVCGDVFHRDDVAWLNIFREGTGAVERVFDSLGRLATLDAVVAYSGHGSATENPAQVIDKARRRYEHWLEDPQKIAWHASKRIFTYALMIEDGIPEALVIPYLVTCGWLADFSRTYMQEAPDTFARALVDELLRIRAVTWEHGRLKATTPYTPPSPEWIAAAERARPQYWE